MSLARRIGTVTLLSMATNLAALLKNAAIAARFGVSGNADLVVYGEGVLLFLPTLLLVRECYGMFVSVYGRVLETKGTDEAGRVYASGLRGVLVAGAVLSLLLFLLPHALMRLIAPGLPPEQIARGAWLLRWISPALLLQEVSEFTRTVHNAHHRYVVPGIVLLGGNLFQAAALLAFAAPQAMTAWIVGLTGAALLQASLMVGLAPRFDPRRLASREIFHPEIRRLGRLVAPVAAGVVLIQIAGYLERAVLSFLPAGSLATLAYSRKVIAPLQTVLAASVALPIYVTMSRTAAGAADDRASTFSRGIEINVLLFIPIMVLIFLLAPEIVSLTFHRGRFRVEDVASTVPLLRIGILAILPASVLMLLRDFLYASARTRPLVLGGAIQLTVTAAANLLLARRHDPGGTHASP